MARLLRNRTLQPALNKEKSTRRRAICPNASWPGKKVRNFERLSGPICGVNARVTSGRALMGYKPNDFFVGLVDFFAIVLPGALLAFLCLDLAEKHIFGAILPSIRSQAEGWAGFLLAAYLFGQFISLIGATFMDWIYDHTYLRYRRRDGDLRYEKAKKLAGDYADLAGVLKWAGAFVRLRSADAALEIDRFEATSKFFRGLFVVLLVYLISFISSGQWVAVLVVIALLALSFWRFSNQRWKFTELSYLYYIALNAHAETEGKKL
jgi:general stress protein CsbA